MNVTRHVRLILSPPTAGDNVDLRLGLLATELLDALNRLVPTLPPGARVEPRLLPDDRCMGSPCALTFSWEDDL